MQDHRYPLTRVQAHQMLKDLGTMKEQADATYRLISTAYGDADPKAIRAGEVSAAIQRLIWELERGSLLAATA